MRALRQGVAAVGAVTRKELYSYLVSPMAYVVAAVFLLINGFIFFLILFFFLLFFFALFSYCLERFGQTRAYWWLALSAVYFSYPLVACLNINTSALVVPEPGTLMLMGLGMLGLACLRRRTA